MTRSVRNPDTDGPGRCGNSASCCQQDGDRVLDFGDDRLEPEQRRVRSAAFLGLLRTGRPVSARAVAQDAQTTLETVTEVLSYFAGRGSVQYDDHGRVVGIAGLGVQPTRHVIHLPWGRRWTWCSLDAVGIVAAVGSGKIDSTGPGGEFHIVYRDAGFDPAGLAVFVADGYGMTSSLGQWCPLVDFFATVEAADRWSAEQGVEGRGVPLLDIAEVVGDRWRAIIEGR